MRDRVRRIRELIRHRRAFRKVEKTVFKRRTWRGITHDLDKLLLLFTPLKTNYIRDLHKRKAKHHNPKTLMDYYERLVDIECTHLTKTNKPLGTRFYLENYIRPENPVEYLILNWLMKIYDIEEGDK